MVEFILILSKVLWTKKRDKEKIRVGKKNKIPKALSHVLSHLIPAPSMREPGQWDYR